MIKICVHEFLITDSEDVDLWAADLIYKWQQTDKGRWVMDNSLNKLEWTQSLDHRIYGWQCKIFAEFADLQMTEYSLRWL